MSKDSHFTGQPVYSQVLKLLDKEKILKKKKKKKRGGGGGGGGVWPPPLFFFFFSPPPQTFFFPPNGGGGGGGGAPNPGHLGMNYLVRRSTLAEANIRRPQEFFASVYAYLLRSMPNF